VRGCAPNDGAGTVLMVEEPVLTLDSTRLRAEPGGQVQLSVKVRNPGHLVESFRLEVLGLDPSWSQVHPPELPVYPGKEESAIVVLSPPAHSQAPDEALPFAVRARSTLDPERSVVEEGDLEVGRILDLQAAIVPVTSRARWSGRHRVTYTNWGNSTVHLRLSVVDKDAVLGFQLVPEQVTVPVGGSAGARLRVRARKPFLRGTPVHRAFQVIGESGTGPPPGTPRSAMARAGVPDPGRPVLDGAMQQQPILSRALVMLAGLLVAALVALIAVVLQTAKVPGAGVPDAAPETPTGLTAVALSDKLIQLRWNPSDRATKYQILKVDKANGPPLEVVNVADGATATAAKLEKANERACYEVVAIRTLPSPVSKPQCATTMDGGLRAPQNVKVVQAGAQYTVSWTDKPEISHVILLQGSQVGSLIAPAVNSTQLAIPAGHQCVRVIGRLGEDKSSPPSEEKCVDSTSTPATTPPGGVVGVPGGGPATATAAPGTAGLKGWVAVLGPYVEQAIAQNAQRLAQASGANAQIVQASQLPQLGFTDPKAILVVVSGFTSGPEVQNFCNGRGADASGGCAPLLIPG
jgi:hypothetical protein